MTLKFKTALPMFSIFASHIPFPFMVSYCPPASRAQCAAGRRKHEYTTTSACALLLAVGLTRALGWPPRTCELAPFPARVCVSTRSGVARLWILELAWGRSLEWIERGVGTCYLLRPSWLGNHGPTKRFTLIFKLFYFLAIDHVLYIFFAGEQGFLITQGGLSAEARRSTDSIPEWSPTAVRGVLRL